MAKVLSILQNIGKYSNMYKEYLSQKKNIKHSKPTIFLFGAPFHSNMGDQAQTYCIIRWLNQNYPEYKIVTFFLRNSTNRILSYIRKTIGPDDKIFCHSGYHLTNLYNEQVVYKQLVKLFPDVPIVIFPQTINYTTTEAAQETATLFNGHSRLTILCRDEVSFDTAKSLFNKCQLFLYPDVVTSLIGTKQFNKQRDGILFCIRNDKEAFYKKEEINNLIKKLEPLSKIDMTDTTIQIPASEIIKDREKYLNEIFNEYSGYKLIITDRYHGTIFSLISGTPVIVLSSSDHKLSSGVKWFPQEYSDYVAYAKSLDDAYDMAVGTLNKQLEYKLSDYFLTNYWNVLKSKLNGQ